MNTETRKHIMKLYEENDRQHARTKAMLNELLRLEALEDLDREDNWTSFMDTTFKALMRRDERIGEALIDSMRQIRQDIETISKQKHKGEDFLKMLGRMARVTGLCEEIGLIDCGRRSYRHTMQYFVNADGDLSNGL